ncbi:MULTISPECIES: ATP-binding protein [Thiomicrorhabdus]|uniref:histidine kinase n=1 Tax=Thiomicrorhabdus heinhorstiae TaxID=2748010 RepID=A0ABS0BVF1_9GAMM|nr:MULTISPECIES: ATP-binding protein [Thiomicrorhabdus]MBF6057784.1 sensor histidine kinase N-terminal domain-containing protein [Thiomicrorhabdus heinhorstiae]
MSLGPSLSRRLMIATFTVLLLSYSVITLLNHNVVSKEVEEIYDAELKQYAYLVSEVVKHAPLSLLDSLNQVPKEHNQEDYTDKIIFQILNQRGKIIGGSQFAPTTPLIDKFTPLRQGYYNIEFEHGLWRGYMLPIAPHYWLITAEHHKVRSEIINNLTHNLLFSLLLGFPLILLFVFVIFQAGFSPLKRITRLISRKDPYDLKPILRHDTPKEIQPFINEINQLMQRIQNAIHEEKSFTSDAAHELRTPLAALKIQIDLLQSCINSPEHLAQITAIQNTVKRTLHLADQMLNLYKAQPELQREAFKPLQLQHILTQSINTLYPLISYKKIDLEVEGAEQYDRVLGNEVGLLQVFVNLLHNAVQYTPNGGQIHIKLQSQEKHIYCCIEDSGDGVPDDKKPQIFKRFYRQEHHRQRADGCGLGLTIVAKILLAHQVDIEVLDSDLGGLKICLLFEKLST